MTKRKLNVLSRNGETKPTLETMRQRLGGPRDEDGSPRTREGGFGAYKGDAVVVLHEDPRTGRVDLWLGEGRAVRANGDELTALTGDAPTALQRVAADLQVYLALVPDARVAFLTADGKIRQGKLIERCRFGGLVALDEGAVLGIGFARFLADTPGGSTDQHLA